MSHNKYIDSQAPKMITSEKFYLIKDQTAFIFDVQVVNGESGATSIIEVSYNTKDGWPNSKRAKVKSSAESRKVWANLVKEGYTRVNRLP